jgi:hypothetical protein
MAFGASDWIEKQREYLGLEREAERLQLADKLTALSPQECQEIGISLLLLDVESSCTSLFGRVKYKIIRKDHQPLPIHSFKVGDEAELFEYKRASNTESASLTGIISKVTSLYVEMVCDESDGVIFEVFSVLLILSRSTSSLLFDWMSDHRRQPTSRYYEINQSSSSSFSVSPCS